MLIHPEQLVDNVSRISCGDEHGTGFFISLTRLLTARHVIVDHITDACEIILQTSNADRNGMIQFQGKLIDHDEKLDVAIIELIEERPIQTFIPVALDYIRYNEEWDTFGYPFAKLAEGLTLNGTILALIRNLPYDISLVSDDVDTRLSYSGLSGSPLIMFGKVSGIITWSTIRGLGAISIKKIAGFLEKNEVKVENLIDASWSNDFLAEIDRAVSNDEVIEKVQETLNTGGQYYLLHGSPGSGKSMIASTIRFDDAKRKIIGQYLIRTPGDITPIYVKASREHLMQWMEDLVSKTLTGEPAAKENIAWNDRVSRLSAWLGQLNDYFSAKDETAVIVVDGLDEILANGNPTSEFLAVLPENLPSHIMVLLSCTSAEILPANITSKLTDEQKIHVTPLSQTTALAFVHQENQRLELGLTITQETLLAQKSEGHPLYLRYLIETLKVDLPSDKDKWIALLPKIDGDIKNYYELLWSSQIMPDADKYWLTLIGSQLREPATQEEFTGMLPTSVRQQYHIKFKAIRHLFKTDIKLSIYHNSFENFIAQKAQADIKLANQYISDFNLSARQSVYALKNLLHHLLLSTDPLPAITYCNQKWADDCAWVHMEPDSIIDDIRRVESLCIDEGAAAELIRVKLLLQRLRFRYNNVLAKHAFEITDTLIQMGNSGDALKYILRGDILLVSLDDSIYFLQKLYETGAYKEAALLFEAIDIRFKAMVEKAQKGEGMNLQGFVYNLQAITLSISANPFEEVMPKFMRGMQLLKNLEDNAKTPTEQKQYIHQLREYISSWNLGYFIYRFGAYPGIEKIAEISAEVYSDSSAQHLAQAAVNSHHFKEIGTQGKEENDAYSRLIADIEKLISEYGYREQDIELLIKTLIEESKNPALMEGLITKQLANNVDFNFRKINGVDADTDAFVALFNQSIYSGYVDKAQAFPSVANRTAKSWELFIKSAFELVGFITGKIYRLKAEGRPEEIAALEAKSRALVVKLNFSLSERVQFDRSYLLIEEIMPLLYHRLTGLYLEFQTPALNWFIEHIINPANNQLGQYTEGYRRTLAQMARLLAENPAQKQFTFKVTQVLEQHIYLAVQNRWQRTPELIQVVDLYAKIGSKSKAKHVYQQMLDTSMGPSWYKEDQLVLINSVLRKMNTPTANEHYVDFAAGLEFASGEMTFQRYVQSEMHGFVGTLAKSGHLSKAIDYFKFQLLPPPDVILANAEASVIDAPAKGDGYVLGARAIIEESAMLQLLEAVDADPYVTLALSEVFLIGTDTKRYMDGFADIQYAAYLKAKSIPDADAEQILQRIGNITVSPRLADDSSKYVYQLSKAFDADFEELSKVLISAGVSTAEIPEKKKDEPEKKEREYSEEEDAKMAEYGLPLLGVGKMSNFPKITAAIQAAQNEFDIENNDVGRQILIDCLKLLTEGEADIWQGKNLTSELGVLFDSLKNHGSAVELIHDLKDLILDHLTDDWRVANFLMGLLSAKISDDEKEKVILIVKEHIEILIRSKGIHTNKYKWLTTKNEPAESKDSQLVNFLIWLLNHPYESVQSVVLESLQWLALVRSEVVIPALVEYSLSTGVEMAKELSTYLLKIIATSQPASVWAAIKEHPNQDQILAIDNMMARIYWQDILTSCSSQDATATALHQGLISEFPDGNVTGSDVYLDDHSLIPIEDLLDDLNNMEILNRAFCEGIMENVSELSKPLSVIDQRRVEKYIRRSFYEEDIEVGHYTYLLRSAVNKSLIGRVGKSQIDEVSTILELPNL